MESALVSIAGAVVGLVAAHWLLAAIVTLAPGDIPRLTDVSVNIPVVLFTFTLSLAAALGSASVTMLQTRERSLLTDLNEATRSTASRRTTTARATLVAVQIALSVVLTTAAGLILRSYINVHQLDLGFVPDRVVTLDVDSRLAGAAYNEWVRELLDRVERLPGVESAGAIHMRPLVFGAIGTDSTIVLEGQPNTRQSGRLNPLVNYQSATPGYFPTMRIRLTEGRLFNAQDQRRSPRVAIVSESTARRLWPGQNPIGRRLTILSFSAGETAGTWRTVVGVVGDVRYRGLDDVRLDVYEPAAQSDVRAGYLLVRSTGNNLAVAAAVKAEARRMEPRTIVSGITSMEAVVGRATAMWTFSVWMFGLFATAAAILVSVGLFSTVSLDAARRSGEFALRIALGARSRDIARHALTSIGAHVVVGTAVGLVLALLGMQAMSRLLFGVSPLDTLTFAGVVCVTALTVTVGCLVPVYRATHIDPASALRRD
jgi:putative ABC transport system permease protein